MWNYTEQDAHDRISLHDCRVNRMFFEAHDLILNFPDGFWMIPTGENPGYDKPVKTGSAQLRMHGFDFDQVAESIDLFKTTYFFRRPIVCRRITMDFEKLCKMVNAGTHELEFLWEYHRPGNALYQCCLWRKNHGFEVDCQFEARIQSTTYRWNEIRPDCEW